MASNPAEHHSCHRQAFLGFFCLPLYYVFPLFTLYIFLSLVQVFVTWDMLGIDHMAMDSTATTTTSRSNGSAAAGKERLRWTQDLHDRFVQAVERLGGPDSKFMHENM